MLEKSVSYAVGQAAEDLADNAEASLKPVSEIFAESEDHYRAYWSTSDIVLAGQTELQQGVRWNLFQLAQATACADVAGIPAKGVSGSGYDGHYFWDQEVYLLPYLTYTNPGNARQVLEFRHDLLPEAKIRAKELSVDGALFPWRTINGLEASAYYAAGTAQFHIAAAIAFATNRYIWASGDTEFQATLGSDLLIETARMWVSLGFFGKDGLFHIHGVTGPDEYTAVVNDNLYTNVMARFNLRAAAALDHPEIDDAERQLWEQAANRMQLPYDEDLQVHSQDNDFMTLEPWDWTTPRSKYPLLLHFHPLVIYRHQVLKQADTVLAMFLQWQDFTAEEKRRAFDFYDPITTGDSTLSACVQGIMAAEVGYGKAALDHFTHALFIDLDDTHGNTIDGVHIASTGGVWSSLVSGFAGLRDQGAVPYFDPAAACRMGRPRVPPEDPGQAPAHRAGTGFDQPDRPRRRAAGGRRARGTAHRRRRPGPGPAGARHGPGTDHLPQRPSDGVDPGGARRSLSRRGNAGSRMIPADMGARCPALLGPDSGRGPGAALRAGLLAAGEGMGQFIGRHPRHDHRDDGHHRAHGPGDEEDQPHRQHLGGRSGECHGDRHEGQGHEEVQARDAAQQMRRHPALEQGSPDHHAHAAGGAEDEEGGGQRPRNCP